MSQVVIGDILPYTQALAIASQTVFGTNWTANAASDVVVYQTPSGDDPDDLTQILPYPSGYSVAFIGASQEVQVTLVTGASAGDIITITRQTPADRENLYTNTNFVPSMLNNDFGILTLVDQQAQLVNQLIGPRYNYSAIIVDVVDTILPILAANQFWVKNASNTAIVAATVNGSAGTGTVNLGTINQLAWYAATGTAVSGLAVGATNSMLTTNSSGVPTWATSIAPTSILDANGNLMVNFTATPSAVNYIQITNNVTGHAPAVGSAGADSAIPLLLSNKNSFTYFVDSTGTAGAQIRLYNAALTQYTAFKAADSQASSVIFTVPALDGTSLAPLVTDGSGNLSFLPGAWVSFSGTIGYTGFTGSVTTTYALYKKIGNTVFININCSGTSNTTAFTITGLPFSVANSSCIPFCFATDNSANTICSGSLSGTTLTLYNTTASLATGWTNSGTKGFACYFFYETT